MKDKILDAVMDSALAIFGGAAICFLIAILVSFTVTAWRLVAFLIGGVE